MLSARDYCRLGVETEIAFRLGDDLPEVGNRQQVADAVESCMAAIELIEDLRHDYKRLDAAAMVAGNVWNAGVVLGTPLTEWRTLDLERITAQLSINGQKIGNGTGGERTLELRNLPRSLAGLDSAPVHHCDAGGVVAAIFHALEPLEEEGCRAAHSDIPNDSAHRIFWLTVFLPAERHFRAQPRST